jgi:hypothetical protein
MKVEFKDRETQTEYLRGVLNWCEIPVDYPMTDLILRAQQKIAELGGDLTLKDAIQVKSEWQKYWEDYSKKQSKPEEVEGENPNLLKQAMEVLDDYLNAGFKEARKEASEKAKIVYKEYFGVDYKNKNDR